MSLAAQTFPAWLKIFPTVFKLDWNNFRWPTEVCVRACACVCDKQMKCKNKGAKIDDSGGDDSGRRQETPTEHTRQTMRDRRRLELQRLWPVKPQEEQKQTVSHITRTNKALEFRLYWNELQYTGIKEYK